MKVFVTTSFTLALLVAAHAIPVEQQQDIVPVEDHQDITQTEDGGSRTWSAITSFFRPAQTWIVEQLPDKTPSDLFNDAKQKAVEVRDWANENQAIQSLVAAIQPLRIWVTDTATTLKDKTFNDMYSDVREGVSQVDEKVGTFLNEQMAQ